MSCNCGGTQKQGKQYCQTCQPDEFSWLIRVDTQPDPFLMDSSHAYITPDNTVFVLDHTRSKAVPISGGGGGVDLSKLALKSELESKVKDLLAEIAGLKTKIKTYKAGKNIEITTDNTINNTYDDKTIRDRLSALENMDLPVYYAGQGISIGPDKAISAEVTLDKVNEVVTRAVTDTEINLNSSHLVVEGNNLVWKGTLNTGRQITSSVPLSSLGVNQSAIDELIRRITNVENRTDRDTTYTAGTGITLSGNTFSANTNVLATKASVDALANRLTTQESKVDKDTEYTAGEGLLLEGTTFKVDGTKVASKTSLDNVINRLLVQEAKRDNNTTYTIMKENSNIVLQGSDGSRSVVVDNAGANVSLTPIYTRLTALENKQDRDTTYTAGRGIAISNNTISIDTSMKRYGINDGGTLGEIYTPSGVYSFRTAGPQDPERHDYLPSFDTDGRSELRLNFTSLKGYIDKGDRLILTELNRTDNKYNAVEDIGETIKYAVSGKRRDNKSVDTYAQVQFTYNATGVDDNNAGIVGSKHSGTSSFFIDLSKGRKSFYETIRIPHIDLELTLHGDIEFIGTNLCFYDCRCLVTTGKLINKVEYKEIKFINNQVSFSRNIDGRSYTLAAVGKPKINVFQKEFER